MSGLRSVVSMGQAMARFIRRGGCPLHRGPDRVRGDTRVTATLDGESDPAGSLDVSGADPRIGATCPPRCDETPSLTVEAPDPLHAKHVLVVGINYAPEPFGIAPYTTGMAEHLAARGACVTVLTGLPHYPTGQVEPRYQVKRRHVELPANGAGPAVIRLRHPVPARHANSIRASAAWLRYQLTFLLRAVTTVPPRPPDLVLATTPSPGAAVAGTRIARRYDVPLLVVVQDLISGPGRDADSPAFAAGLERYCLRQADRVAVVSESLRPAVAGYDVPGDRIDLLPNWSHLTASPLSRNDARQRLGWPAGSFVVAHSGALGADQDLPTVLAAARQLPRGVELMLLAPGGRRTSPEIRAARLPNLRTVDLPDDDSYPLALAAADLLLISERALSAAAAPTRRLTSYLGAGRPILAAVPADGATAAELRRTGGAALLVPPGDPRQLAEAVLALVDDPARRAGMARAGADYADHRLRREDSLRRLDAMVDAVLTDATPAT